MIATLLQKLASKYPHYGFSMLFGLIRQQGHRYNHKRVYRLYCELKLNLKRKPKKRLAPRTAQVLEQPERLNTCWSLDYMTDRLNNGRRFRTANVIDDCNRECLGITASLSLPSVRVTDWLDKIAHQRGYPKYIRVDNGPENIAKHFRKWAEKYGIEIKYIQPGKPSQNGYIERFNRSYREAILDRYLFVSIQHVQLLTDEWLEHYNGERPHQALGMQTPWAVARQLGQQVNSALAVG